MKRLWILIFIISVFSLKGNAQINPEIYNYWENLYYVNPADIHFNYNAYLTLNTRAQWVDFPGAPVSVNLTAAFPIEKIRSQVATKLFVDRIGYTNTVEFLLSYAYSLRINYDNSLTFGVSGALHSRTYDFSKISADDMLDPTIYSEKVNGLLEGNMSLGLEYNYKDMLQIGVSARNFMSYFPALREKRRNPLQSATNMLYAKYLTHYFGESNCYMDFGAAFRQYDKRYVGDFMTSVYYDFNSDYSIQLQLFGGTVGDIGFSVGFNLLSDLKLLCSYNYNYAIVNTKSYGTFEIMLTYGFKKCPTCINVW
jgi:type IX secretion system PorP/SprF family membrane protein